MIFLRSEADTHGRGVKDKGAHVQIKWKLQHLFSGVWMKPEIRHCQSVLCQVNLSLVQMCVCVCVGGVQQGVGDFSQGRQPMICFHFPFDLLVINILSKPTVWGDRPVTTHYGTADFYISEGYWWDGLRLENAVILALCMSKCASEGDHGLYLLQQS